MHEQLPFSGCMISGTEAARIVGAIFTNQAALGEFAAFSFPPLTFGWSMPWRQKWGTNSALALWHLRGQAPAASLPR